MSEPSAVVGFVGLLVVAAILLKDAARRLGLPSAVLYILLGGALALLGAEGWLPEESRDVLRFLSGLGVACLLFRVGLESDLPALRRQLGRATWIWAGNVVVSGGAGFAAAYWVLGADLVPSLVVATVLTATSLGVTVSVWGEGDALETEEGELLLDVAELDDLSAVVAFAVLFAAVPVLHGGGGVLLPVSGTVAVVLAKILAFGGLCYLFSRHLERRLTAFLGRDVGGVDLTVVVVGIALAIAALAGTMGLSLAVGAFFAGLAFSRDPQAVTIDASFCILHDFFVPFFFVEIGLSLDPGVLGPSMGAAGVLVVAAFVGKFLGNLLPALPLVGRARAVLLGVSMIPRAEIAMVVAGRAVAMGPATLPGQLFGGLVAVVLVTSSVAPVMTRRALSRWAAGGGKAGDEGFGDGGRGARYDDGGPGGRSVARGRRIRSAVAGAPESGL